MSAPKISWKLCLALVAALVVGATAANAATTIAVSTCNASTPNADRFGGGCGARVSFDGSASNAWVGDYSPSVEGEYRLRYYVNLRNITTAGDGFDGFAAYSGTDTNGVPPANSSRLRITYEPAAFGEENLVVTVRLANNTEVSSSPVLLKHGWHSVEVRWKRSTASTNDGLVELWVDGVKKNTEMAALQNIDNNVGPGTGIDHARLGAPEGVDGGTGFEQVDDFASQRTGYIGPTAAFGDVPTSHQFFKEIQGFYAGGITGGCGENPLIFCPTNNAIRGAMAVFIMRAKALYVDHNPSYSPPPKANIFSDPEFDDANCASNNPLGCSLLSQEPWAEAMYNAGITQGCNTSPLMYCPANSLTRNGLAVFLLRALEGPSYVPPPKQNIFQDPQYDDANCATNGNPAGCNMIPHEALVEEFYNRGITTGCGASPLLFCPSNNGLRQTIAVFMSRALSIPYHQVGP